MLREDDPSAVIRLLAKVERKLLYHHQWFVHMDRHGADPLCPDFSTGFDLIPPCDRFWADPFPWFHDGRNFVFVEELPFSTGKGHISVIEFDGGGRVERHLPVLTLPWHLSYPYLFDWDGELWMLPEAGHSGRLTLYRCKAFPDRWEEAAVLLEGVRTVDPTLIAHDGRWWLFVNIAPVGARIDDDLHLYFADSPLGPFQPHPKNPVRTNPVGARPAGTPFWRDGVLYRPAQDCGVVYGLRTVVNRVTVMTTEAYAEVPFAAIEPGWKPGVLRTHTLSVRGDWRAVDALRCVPKWLQGRKNV